MSINQQVLEAHRISTRIDGNRLFALQEYLAPNRPYNAEWLDVTDWSLFTLYAWLGY